MKLSRVGEKTNAGGYSRIFSWVLKLLKAIQKNGKDKDHQHEDQRAVKKDPPGGAPGPRPHACPHHSLPLRTDASTTFPARMTKKRTISSALA